MKRLKSMLCFVLLLVFTSTMMVGCGKKATTLTEEMVSLSETVFVYDGTEKKPDVSVVLNGDEVSSSLYSVKYSNNIDAGVATVTVSATGKKNKTISGSVSLKYTIKPAELGEILAISGTTYNGQNQVPTVSIENFTVNEDYTLSWSYKEIGAKDSEYVSISGEEFIDAGVYKVVATGFGNYTGEKTATYEIAKTDYQGMTVSRENYVYSSEKTNIVLSENILGDVKYYYGTTSNFTQGIEFSSSTEFNVGTYYFYAEVLSDKNHNSFVTPVSSFEVTAFDISNASVTFEEDSYSYTGNPILAKPEVKNGSVVLVENTDYTLSYSNNTYEGIATVTVLGMGNYTGTKSASFEIIIGLNPCEKHTPADAVIENIIPATLDADGSYDEVVRCSICFGVVSNAEHKINKVNKSDIVVDNSAKTYCGEEIKPEVSIAGFVLNEDYEVSYNNNVNAGTAEVIIEFINPYYDILVTENFVINKAVVTEPKINGTFTYNGSEQTAIKLTGNELFTVSEDNVQTNAGRYVVVVSLNDKDNYMWETAGDSEDLILEFIINKAVVDEPTITESFTYNGNVQCPAEPPADAPYGFNMETAEDVGIYFVNVYLKDADNYVWANHPDRHYFTLAYKIEPLEIEEPTLECFEFTYNGEPHSPTLSYTNDVFEMVGDLSATDAGTYRVAVRFKNPTNYKWVNGERGDYLFFEYVINKAKVAEPTITGTFTYNGNEQTAIEVPEDAPFTVSEENTQTNAGEYEVVVSLNDKDNYEWSAGGSEDLTLDFVINKVVVAEPTITGIFTYNGSEQTAIEVPEDAPFTVSEENTQTNAGEYEVVVSLNDKDNYEWETAGNSEDLTLDFVINKVVVTEPTITGTFTYNGSEQTAIEVPADAHYSVSADNVQINAGEYEVVVSLNDKDNYEWSAGDSEDLTLDFVINKLSIEDAVLELSSYEYVYSGELIEPEVTLTLNSKLLVIETEYIVEYNNNKNAGFAEVIVSGTGNYIGKLNEAFEITKKIIAEPTIEGEYTYNRDVQTAQLSYESEDFVVTKDTATNAGTYYVIVKLADTDNYIWENNENTEDLSLEFVIKPMDLSSANLTLSETEFVFTGEKIEPDVTVEIDLVTLSKDTDYVVSYLDNTKKGTAWAIVQGTGNYTGEARAMFTIGIKIVNEPTIVGNYVYTGEPQTAELSVKSEYFTTEGLTQINAGEYEVILKLVDKDSCVWSPSGSTEDIVLTFIIEKATVKQPKIDGTYTYNKTAQSPTLVNTVDSDRYIVSNVSATNAGEYFVSISLKDTLNYMWSEKLTSEPLSLGFVIEKIRVQEPQITGEYIYNGQEQIAKLSIEQLEYYDVLNRRQTAIGEYDVTVKLKDKDNFIWDNNDNANDLVLKFVILGKSLEDAEVKLSQTTYVYSKLAFNPTVTVTLGDLTLTKDIDFVVEYLNNINAGTATVVVSGIYNYYGEVQVNFEITPQTVTAPIMEDKQYYYNGTEQTIIITPSTSDYFTIENNKQTVVGDYVAKAVLSDKTNYIWAEIDTNEDIEFNYTINRCEVVKPTQVNSEIVYTYNGKEQEMKFNGINDFISVEGNKQTEAGEYEVVISLADKDNYCWIDDEIDNNTSDLNFKFVIEKLIVDNPKVTGQYYYTGESQTIVTDGEHYTVTNGTNTNAGTHKATAVLNNKNSMLWKDNNNSDDYTFNYTIEKVDLNAANYSIDNTFTYTGEAIKPTLNYITINDRDLTLNVDYELSYENNVNAGYGKITITGINNYTGKIEEGFVIECAEILESDVELSKTSKVYDNSNYIPTVTVSYAGETLEEDTHYTLTWTKNNEEVSEMINAGTYVLNVSGLGNYTSEVQITFTIEKAEYENIVLTKDSYNYENPSKVSLVGDIFGDVTYYYSEVSSDSWLIYNDEELLEVGNYYIYAVIEETENYKEYETDKVEFSVLKSARQGISVSRENYGYGNPSAIEVLGYELSDYQLYYYAEGQTVSDAVIFDETTVFNAGKYNIFVVVPENEQYEKFISEASSFEVSRVDYPVDLTVSRDTYQYGSVHSQTKILGFDVDYEYVELYYNLTESNVDGTLYTDSDDIDAGTYYIYAIIRENGNYNEYKTPVSELVILKGSYENLNITVEISDINYGEKLTPALSLSDIDGEVSYYYVLENINYSGSIINSETILSAGTYYMYATIAESKNYETYTTVQTMFTVNKLGVDVPAISHVTYTGNAQYPLTTNSYYSVSASGDCINAADYIITLNLIDNVNYYWVGENHSDALVLNYTIKKAQMSSVRVELSNDAFDFDNTEKTPSVTIYLGGVVVAGSEYLVSYKNNIYSGIASVVISAKENSNFEGEVAKDFTINKAKYTNVTVSRGSYYYLQTSEISLSINDVEGEVKYYYNLTDSNIDGIEFNKSDILNAGTYYIYAVISESDNYQTYTTLTSSFTVYKLDLLQAELVLNETEFLYTGDEIKPTIVSLKLNGVDVLSENYELKYENNIDVGTATITVVAKDSGNYSGVVSKNFEIKNLDFSESVITFKDNITEFAYTGTSIKSSIELLVVLGGRTLTQDVDYTWDFATGVSSVNVGKVDIIITAMGAYSGTITTACYIVPSSIENATVYFTTNNSTSYGVTFTGNDQTSIVKSKIYVSANGSNLTTSDFIVTWTDSNGVEVDSIKNSGTYTGVISAVSGGNYTGTASTTITCTVSRILISNINNLKFSPTSATSTGEDLIPTIKIKYLNKTLVLGQDYTIVWKDADGNVVDSIIDAGTYKAEITILTTGNYNYARAITKSFTVN